VAAWVVGRRLKGAEDRKSADAHPSG